MVKRKFVLALLVAVNTAGCAAEHSGNIAESEPSSTTITSTMILLETPVHFTAPDGTPLLVQADDYRVEQTTESHLRLVPEKAGQSLLLAAGLTTHNVEVSKPFPLLLASMRMRAIWPCYVPKVLINTSKTSSPLKQNRFAINKFSKHVCATAPTRTYGPKLSR